MIISASYTTAEHTTIKAVCEDGNTYFIPNPCENHHKEWVDKFLAEEGTIEEPA